MNNDCNVVFTLFNKYTKSNKPSKHFYCDNCRKQPSKVIINCKGCGVRFQPFKLSQIYCKFDCKVRMANRRAYARYRQARSINVKCKFCGIEIPYDQKPRHKICLRCEEGFIKRLHDMKCMLCGTSVKSKMYCSLKCRAYAHLVIDRNKKNDGVL
jgi:hypothetical protein